MSPSNALQQRTRAIGRDIFELTSTAQPRLWHRAWWLERMTRLVESDGQLKTRAFEFVECLPALRNPAELTRHLAEYLDPSVTALPKVFHALVGPGYLQTLREQWIGRFAHLGAAQMAGRFIAGYDTPSVTRTIRRLRSANMAFTLDVLGESTTSYDQAERYVQAYHKLMDDISHAASDWTSIPIIDADRLGSMPRANFSIKLSGLDPHFDPIDPQRAIRVVGERLRPLFRHARAVGAFVNIDMESFKHRDLTLELFTQILMEDEFRDWNDVGIVVQAYLVDGEQDLLALLDWGREREHRFAIRLVKGAYWDAETAAAVRHHSVPPVWQKKWQSDAAYEKLSRIMLGATNIIRPAFASHNVRSLATVMATAEQLGLSARDYELQMLYGMGDPLKSAMEQLGQCVRVYLPYGDLMPGMGYLIRRLLENTSNDGFLKQSFDDRSSHDRLLMNPAELRPPSQPLPQRYYQDTEPEQTMPAFVNASNTSFTSPDNRKKMVGAIAYVRADMGRDYAPMIDGEAITTDAIYESINPSCPSEVIGRIGLASVSDVDEAVHAARRAFAKWRAVPAKDRSAILRKVADRLEMRRFELAATMILEVGKPWGEADAEVTEAIDHCRYYAEQIEHIESRPRLRNIPGENNMLTYAPKGVCAVMSPWPFPLSILTGMATAALAAGNTVVIKPARAASVVAAKLIEIFQDVGLPDGVVNFLPGDGSTIGRHLVSHEGVHVVAFTGSHEVGTEVIRAGSAAGADQPFIRKMIVEMGGKNAIIIDDDADLDGALQAVIDSAFSYAGQRCSSCSRLIVLDGVYDALCARLREAVESIPIGPAEAPGTLLGPVIDQAAYDRLQAAIGAARKESRPLTEVALPEACAEGFYIPPTVFLDVDPSCELAQREHLGPILAVMRADNFDDALTIANGTRYALTGGLYSRSPAHIERARREFAVGNLYINRPIIGSQVDAQPFGGFKLSGTGVKAGSPDYLLHFMDARCITENTARSGLVPTEEQSEVS